MHGYHWGHYGANQVLVTLTGLQNRFHNQNINLISQPKHVVGTQKNHLTVDEVEWWWVGTWRGYLFSECTTVFFPFSAI